MSDFEFKVNLSKSCMLRVNSLSRFFEELLLFLFVQDFNLAPQFPLSASSINVSISMSINLPLSKYSALILSRVGFQGLSDVVAGYFKRGRYFCCLSEILQML